MSTASEAHILESTSSLAHQQRRSRIPDKPTHSLSLWSIMRNCIGKELSKIPMPVNFNEPLSFLQRITEDIEYSALLDRASAKQDSCEQVRAPGMLISATFVYACTLPVSLQLCLVCAFAVSSYSTTSSNRATKPFNPLLGETYECDRWDDLGWRSLCEQASYCALFYQLNYYLHLSLGITPSTSRCTPLRGQVRLDDVPGVQHDEQVPRQILVRYSNRRHTPQVF